MKNFNSSMADDYRTSQSNLQSSQQQPQPPTDMEELELERERAARAGSQSGSRPQLLLDEMQQDLQYLAREAPLDGGESTFGAYSQLGGGGGSQHGLASSQLGLHEQQLLLRADDEHDERQDAESMMLAANYQRGSPLRAETPASGHNVDQLAPDNVDIQRPLQQQGFLVSFMVDARGGAMRGCRHSGVRVIIPPNSAQMPMRITCRYLRRERLVHPPPLMEGEACASKIMEVGPAGAKFLAPVLLEVPHFASLGGQEREIIILRSDSGDVWREHLADADEQLVASIIESAESTPNKHNYDQENQEPATGGDKKQQQQQRRLTRIVTNEFPQYFAIISRIRQEVHAVGPAGSAVDSQVVPKVQATFTEGALTKRIKIGLQKGVKHQDTQTSSTAHAQDAHQQPGDQQPELAALDSPADRPSSPQSQPGSQGRPSSALKRRSRFLACFGAGHGSVDLLTSTDESSGGGDSPRHQRDPLERSDGGSNSADDESPSKRLVPDDYYIEREPPLILNVEPTTYGKRLASSSAQTDSKLNVNGYMSTSARTPKKRSGLLRKRRAKTQVTINLGSPTEQQQQQPARPKSALDSSLADESAAAESSLEPQLDSDDADLIRDVVTSSDHKWRTCTIQTDSDSVTINYVTLAHDPTGARAAVTSANAATQVNQDDAGYVSGSGDLNRQSSFGKGLFGLPSCKGKKVDEEDDAQMPAASGSEDEPSTRDATAKTKKKSKAAKKSAKKLKEQRVRVSPEAETKPDDTPQVQAPDSAAEQQQESLKVKSSLDEVSATSGGEEDESRRSASPASAKEAKLKQKLEKQEKLKREREEKRMQKEQDELAAKAEKLRKKQEKEAKKQEQKAAKLAAKKNSTSPPASPTPPQQVSSGAEKPSVTFADDAQEVGGSLISAASPDSAPIESQPKREVQQVDSIQQVIDTTSTNYEREKERLAQEDGRDMIQLSLSSASHLDSHDSQQQQELVRPQDGEQEAEQLISLPESLNDEPSKVQVSQQQQQQPLRPILKHQQSSQSAAGEEAELVIGEHPAVMLTKPLCEVATEASDEAVKIADALKAAGDSAVESAQSPDLSSSASLSKKELAKAAKEEKLRLKREAKEKLDQEKRAAKEAKDEAKRLAKEAANAKKVAEEEAKRLAKEAKVEAERVAKVAKEEADRLAKEAKAEKDRLAKEAKRQLKLTKSKVSKDSGSSPEPSAPIEVVATSGGDEPKAAAEIEVMSEVREATESVATPTITLSDENQQEVKVELAELEPKKTGDDSETQEPEGKTKKKSKKDKKVKAKEVTVDVDAESPDVSQKSTSFFSRLFSGSSRKSKRSSKSKDEAGPEEISAKSSEIKAVGEVKPLIVSEMYPSDPDNADGELILEVNMPTDLIDSRKLTDQPAHGADLSSSVSQTIPSSTTIDETLAQSAKSAGEEHPLDDQEATLVNISQLADGDADDDEATENAISQAHDLMQSPTIEREIISESLRPEKSPPTPAEISQVADDLARETLEAAVAEASGSNSRLASSSSITKLDTKVKAKKSKDELKAEKERKELESKLAKEAKRREKEEAKQRKKDAEQAKLEAKKQAKEDKKRKELETKEAKKLEKLAKEEQKKLKKAQQLAAKSKINQCKESDDTELPIAAPAAAAAVSSAPSAAETQRDEIIDMSKMTPVNTETQVEQIVEEVVGEDGVVTKTTRTIETNYVTLRQEEVRMAERQDMPIEEYEELVRNGQIPDAEIERREPIKPETCEQQVLDGLTENKRIVDVTVGAYEHPELDEIRTTPSYFGAELPAEIAPETAPKKVLKKRIKLNGKLVKRAQKLAESEAKKAKRGARKARSEIAVCDEAARQAQKQLKRALKEAKKAQKTAVKEHKKMDKVDKKLAKTQRKIEKRQAKLDKKAAKSAAKVQKQLEQEAKKEAKKAKKLERKSSQKSATGGSRKSIKLEDIGEPVLRSSSRNLSGAGSSQQQQDSQPERQVVDEGVELEQRRASPASDADLNVEMSLDGGEFNPELVHTITREVTTETPDGQVTHETSEQVLRGQDAVEAAERAEIDEEEEEIDVVTPDPDESGAEKLVAGAQGS